MGSRWPHPKSNLGVFDWFNLQSIILWRSSKVAIWDLFTQPVWARRVRLSESSEILKASLVRAHHVVHGLHLLSRVLCTPQDRRHRIDNEHIIWQILSFSMDSESLTLPPRTGCRYKAQILTWEPRIRIMICRLNQSKTLRFDFGWGHLDPLSGTGTKS